MVFKDAGIVAHDPWYPLPMKRSLGQEEHIVSLWVFLPLRSPAGGVCA